MYYYLLSYLIVKLLVRGRDFDNAVAEALFKRSFI